MQPEITLDEGLHGGGGDGGEVLQLGVVVRDAQDARLGGLVDGIRGNDF